MTHDVPEPFIDAQLAELSDRLRKLEAKIDLLENRIRPQTVVTGDPFTIDCAAVVRGKTVRITRSTRER